MSDPMTGQPTTMRMVSEHAPDSEVHRGYEMGEDGAERMTMELKYTRAQ
jgi:hypothetical protein